MEENYIDINKKSWNKRVKPHVESDFYNMKAFREGASSLNAIELELLGDVKGKSILHLQCHFGQDSISLSRLGAKVTAVDFSEEAIRVAKEINDELGTDVDFICCDIYKLNAHSNKKFDIVFTSYGTISWLPDLPQWASIINSFLQPEGQFIFVEFHPIIWMFDDDLQKVHFAYHNKEAIIEEESGTYADRDAQIKNSYVCWNHSLSEVMTSLLSQKLIIDSFREYNYAPYNFVRHMEEYEKGKFHVKHLKDKVPYVYSIIATKNS